MIKVATDELENQTQSPPRTNFANGIIASLAACALLGGVTTLFGWFARLPRLTDWLGSGISMFANTALAAACAGAGLLFERVHQDLKYQGTGIGLAIVRKAAEKMGGRVGVESDGLNGSSFWIELPAVNHQ